MPRFFCLTLTISLVFGYVSSYLVSPVEFGIITAVTVGTFRFCVVCKS